MSDQDSVKKLPKFPVRDKIVNMMKDDKFVSHVTTVNLVELKNAGYTLEDIIILRFYGII